MASVATQAELAGGLAVRPMRGHAGFMGALRSEFTKIRSVRSTYWTLFALVVVCIGIGALFSWGEVQQLHRLASGGGGVFRNGRPGAAPVSAVATVAARDRGRAATTSLFGLLFGQLIIVVLGALTVTSEYSTGMIRTSLTSMPRRGTIFAAKAAVFGAIALVVGLITTFLAFFVGQAILSTQHVNTTLGQPNVLRTVIGGGLFLAVCGLLAFGIGALLRHTAGAITVSIGLLFVLYILSQFLPGSPSGWFGAADFDKWIPFNAGGGIWERFSGTNMFSPWIGFGVFCGYAAVAIIAGLFLFRKRDA